MTLLVIDKHNFYADSYARVTSSEGTRWEEDFPKVFTLNGKVRLGPHLTYTTIGFCGDAHGFLWLYERMQEILANTPELTRKQLNTLIQSFEGRRTLAIMPCPGGVVVITLDQEHGSKVEFRPGTDHVFGGDYHPSTVGVENRAWFSIYIDSIQAGRLPGPKVHYLPHSHEFQDRGAIPTTVYTENRLLAKLKGMTQRIFKKAA